MSACKRYSAKIAVGLFLLTPLAYSQSLSVNWTTDAPILDETSVSGSPVPINNGNDVLYFLFYSEDANRAIDPSNGTFQWNGNVAEQRSDDRLVSAARDNQSLDLREENIVADWEGNPITSDGFFYSLVVNYNDASLDENVPGTWDISIPFGTYAYVSGMTGEVPFDVLSPPTTLNANRPGNWDGSGGLPEHAAMVDFVMIPEPGTIGLLVLGGLVVLKARRRQG